MISKYICNRIHKYSIINTNYALTVSHLINYLEFGRIEIPTSPSSPKEENSLHGSGNKESSSDDSDDSVGSRRCERLRRRVRLGTWLLEDGGFFNGEESTSWCGSVLRRRMDCATSSTRMGGHYHGGWVRGDAMTAVEVSRTNTGWSKHNPLASNPNVVTQRRWLTERGGATRGVAAWANDEQELDEELRWRWRAEGDCHRRYRWREDR